MGEWGCSSAILDLGHWMDVSGLMPQLAYHPRGRSALLPTYCIGDLEGLRAVGMI
jgi:hypothetical protein